MIFSLSSIFKLLIICNIILRTSYCENQICDSNGVCTSSTSRNSESKTTDQQQEQQLSDQTKQFKKRVDKSPNDIEALYSYAVSLYNNDRLPLKSAEVFEKIVKLNPKISQVFKLE